jgi:biotin carboxyl carrier protein
MKLYAHVDGKTVEVELAVEGAAILAATPSGAHEIVLDDRRGSIRTAALGARRIEFGWERENGLYRILIEGVEYEVEVRDARAEQASRVRRAAQAEGGEAVVRAPIPGRIVRVLVKDGDAVVKDQPLLTLDAMKLENEIPAPREGTVRAVHVQAGAAVDKGQAMVTLGERVESERVVRG